MLQPPTSKLKTVESMKNHMFEYNGMKDVSKEESATSTYQDKVLQLYLQNN